MNLKLDSALDVLSANGIAYDDEAVPEMPDIGRVMPGETTYSTSLAAISGDYGESARAEWWPADGDDLEAELPDYPDYWRQWALLRGIAQNKEANSGLSAVRREPPEPHCAWYCPIHYYGHAWGIYIRQSCILAAALEIAGHVEWRKVKLSGITPWEIGRQLLRGAFYALYLHEQFHHKVESLGFRLLVATGTDRYRRYKTAVYRPTFLTPNCLEESLANAESYRRVSEEHYKARQAEPFRTALRFYLELSFGVQPPGYSEALNFLGETASASGQHRLQSLILDGKSPPNTPITHWSVAPDVIRALMNVDSEIYVIVPTGASPLFRPTIDPGYTVSTDAAKKGLVKHHGYNVVPGGKGSHVKLSKPGAATIVLTGNQDALSPGVLKDVLSKLGGHPLSRARDVLEGRT